MDENEAQVAASAVFDRLDADHDGTLDEKELHGRMSRAEVGEADPDKDRTLTKSEYAVFVGKAFRAANPDGDHTIDASEMGTPAGRRLILLIQ